jgi:hypothetical protein
VSRKNHIFGFSKLAWTWVPIVNLYQSIPIYTNLYSQSKKAEEAEAGVEGVGVKEEKK